MSSPVHVVVERGLWADALVDALRVHGLLIERWPSLDVVPDDGHRMLVVLHVTHHGWCTATRLVDHDPSRVHVLLPAGLPRHHVLVEAVLRAVPSAVSTDAIAIDALASALQRSDDRWSVSWPVAAPLPFTGSVRRVLRALACQPDTRTRLARALGLAPSTLDVHLQAIKAIVRTTLEHDPTGDGHVSNEWLVCWARDHGYGLLPDAI